MQPSITTFTSKQPKVTEKANSGTNRRNYIRMERTVATFTSGQAPKKNSAS